MMTLRLGAQERTPLSAEAGLTFSHFQQQVKQEVGDSRGQRIVHETEIGLHLAGAYQLADWLAAGLYLRFDTGLREAARFDGFDADGKTTVRDRVGGDYNELWVGPLLRGTWRFLQLDVGYGAYGIRFDEGRSDLPSASGDTSASFRLSATIAWLVALGANFPIDDELDLSVRAEYRARYYFERAGEALLDEIHHGTQSVVPMIAVRWRPS
jgi:hypothetical protein